ncbi:MAG: hypothetical protein WC071_04925 [Victivallaceae bacterium]
MKNRNRYICAALLFILLAAVIYGILLYRLPKQVFWVSDGGNKNIVMHNILKYGSEALRYPASDIDPEKQFFPDSYYHFNKCGNRIYSIFPAFFPATAAYFYKVFGTVGPFLISLVSTLLVLFLCALLIRKMQLPVMFLYSLPLLAFATPFFFYSLTFWEMTLSTLFSTAAMLLFVYGKEHGRLSLSWQQFWAGLLLGAGLVYREEMYFLAASAVLAMLVQRKKIINTIEFSVSFAALVMPLWIFQYWRYGHVLGLHGSTYHSHNVGVEATFFQWLIQKFNGYFIYLFKFNAAGFETDWYYLFLLLPFFAAVIVGLIYRDFRRGIRLKIALMLCAAISSLIFTLMLWQNKQPVLNTIFTIGFVTASPLLLPFWLNLRPLLKSSNRTIAFLSMLSLIYCIILCPILTQSDMGIIWGPRHFLLLYPWLVPISLYAVRMMFHRQHFERNRLVAVNYALLIILALAIQLKGVANLFLMKRNAAELDRQVAAASGKLIVSDIFWLVPEIPSLYFDRKFMQFKSGAELSALLDLLKEKNIRQFTLIVSKSANYRKLNNNELTKFLQRVRVSERPVEVDLPGTEFLSVIILHCFLHD